MKWMRPVFLAEQEEVEKSSGETPGSTTRVEEDAVEEIRALKRRRVYYEFGAEVFPFYVTSTVGNVERIVAALGQ